METVLIVVSVVINTLLVAWIVRRLMGGPVGWPRILVFSFIVSVIAHPALLATLEHTGIDDPSAAGTAGVAAAISVLFLAWVIAIEISILVVSEILIPTGSLPGPITLARGLPAWSRRARRFIRIFSIAARQGLIGYLGRSSAPSDRPHRPGTAVALRTALTEGGVTFVKLGQMLSTRPDLLPPAYVTELSRLQSQVPPEPWERVRQLLTTELGAPPEKIFSRFDPEPLAAASLGQVHRATLATGEDVVVKVQRSSAVATVRADLDIITRLAQLLEKRTAWARQMGVVALAEGFGASLSEELDYRTELRNLTSVQGSAAVIVPAGYRRFSTRRVLTMDRIEGIPLSRAQQEIEALTAGQRDELTRTILEVILRQILVDGVFHTDLHGGNILLTPGGSLALLDFGSVGRLDRQARLGLRSLLIAIDRQDGAAATTALCHILIPPADLDLVATQWLIGDLIMRIDGMPADVLYNDLLRAVVSAGFKVPPSIAAAFRCLGALEGTLTLLSPDLDVVDETRDIAASVFRETISPLHSVRSSVEQAALVAPIAERVPAQLSSILGRLDRDNLGLSFSPLADPTGRAVASQFAQVISLSVLTIVAAFSGIAMVLSDVGPHWADNMRVTAYIGMILLLIAYVIGSRLVITTLQRGFQDPRRSVVDR